MEVWLWYGREVSVVLSSLLFTWWIWQSKMTLRFNELVHVLIIGFNTPLSGNSVLVTHWTPTQLQTLVHGQPQQKTTFTTQTHCRLRTSNWVSSPRAVGDSKHLHHLSFSLSNQYSKRRSVLARFTNSIRRFNNDALHSHWRQLLKAIHACHRFSMLSIYQRFGCTCPYGYHQSYMIPDDKPSLDEQQLFQAKISRSTFRSACTFSVKHAEAHDSQLCTIFYSLQRNYP